MTAHAASNVIFGLNPMWVATCILIVTYAIIMSEKVNRAIVALLGAGVMIVVGVLDQEQAAQGHRLEHHRPFDRHDDPGVRSRAAPACFSISPSGRRKPPRRVPPAYCFILQFTTAILSAFLDNVTTVLLVRSGHAGDPRHAGRAGLSVSVRRNLRLQYRRHRDADRRSAEHPDRLPGRSCLQRFRYPSGTGGRRGHGGAGNHDSYRSGARTSRDA